MLRLARPLSFLAAVAILAGCAGPAAPSPTGSSGAPATPFAEFSAGEAGLEGHVLDDSLLPVGNATVVLAAIGADLRPVADFVTGVDGFFAFSHVQPGEYQLVAAATGFANRTLLVRLVSDLVTQASIQLSEIPGTDPYTRLFMKNGMQVCATHFIVGSTTGLAAARNACAQVAAGENISSLQVQVPAGHRAALVEFDWPLKSSSGEWHVYAAQDEKTGSKLVAAGANNKSPHKPVVRVELRAGEAYLRPGDIPLAQPIPYPDPETPFKMYAGVVYGGEHTDLVRTALGPYCETTFCMGIGFQVQWRFTDYVTLFVNQAPGDLDAYSAIPDQ